MSTPSLRINGLSIVVRGTIDDAQAVTPAWLLDHDLLNHEDAQSIQYKALLPGDLSLFESSWFTYKAQNGAIEVSTAQEPEFERLRDLMYGLMKGLPEAAPSLMGVNRTAHIKMASIDAYHAVGDRFANNAAWAGQLRIPGMRSLTTWGVRPDSYGGRVQVVIEPSGRVASGIYVAVNDHFDLTERDRQPESRSDSDFTRVEDSTANLEKRELVFRILGDQWEESMRRADELIAHVAQTGGST